MIDLSDAVDRLLNILFDETIFDPKPRKKAEKRAPIEIGGSVLRYTSNPGRLPLVGGGPDRDSAYEHALSSRRWKSLRKRVANGARIR